MSEQGTTPKRPGIVGKASTETASAAKELILAAKRDFDSPPFGNVIASWSKSGVLLVIVQGEKAGRVADFLIEEGIAIPDGHQPETFDPLPSSQPPLV